MHTKFTLYGKVLVRLIAVFLLIGKNVEAQDLTPWTNGKFGQEWIDYSKKYVRIGVPANGVYKLAVNLLPGDFPKDDPSKFQLWHRGQEVAIISATSSEIVFYGEKNDGASDGLLYRPTAEARTNIYSSLFSDIGSYILTYNVAGKRSETLNGTSYSGDPAAYHYQKLVKTFNNQFSFGTLTTEPAPLNNSFYEIQNSWVGRTIKGSGGSDESSKFDDSFQMTNWASDATEKPTIQTTIIGMHYGVHKLNISVGKTNANHTEILGTLNFSGLDSKSLVTASIPNASLNSTGGIFRVRSTTIAGESNDWTAVANYVLTYPQLTDMSGIGVAYFNFKPSSQAVHLGIANAESDVVLYNISNIDEPKIVTGINIGGTFHAGVTGNAIDELNLLAIRPSEIKAVDPIDITPITLQPYAAFPTVSDPLSAISPGSYDYLIVTATPFLEEAKNYAMYRNSSTGGSFRVAVFEIKSLYAQFNYGEPSGLAIKRFADYMLKDGIRSKHNLLLIGNSVSTPDGSAVRLKKEMPDEVPTIGDPGSDNLLVSGIHGMDENVPAIPIGRIPALSAPGSGSPDPTRVANYLAKIKIYESPVGDKSWRKNLIHLVGAKTGELEAFSGYLNDLIPIAKTLDASKPIQTLTTTGTSSAVQPANITTQINSGTGMVAYYGHGSWNQTQLNIGNITKANNSLSSSDVDFNNFSNQGGVYNTEENNEKFPFMYFNGCGVGNAFSGRNSTYIALASDWLLAPKRGAIAIIASSFNSYPAPTKDYLIDLYREIFAKTDAQRNSIGHIRDDVAKKIVEGNSGARVMAVDPYYIANIHQANLFGDPALRILLTSDVPALPVEFADVKVNLNLNKTVQIQWKTSWEKSNGYFVIERSSDARKFVALGSIEGKGTISSLSSYTYLDYNPNIGLNYYRIKQVDKGGELVGYSYSRVVSVDNPTDGDDEIRVFPNPSSSSISIELMTSSTIKSWSFVNVKGAVLKRGAETSISLEGLPSGEYLLNVITKDGQVYQKKVMKR